MRFVPKALGICWIYDRPLSKFPNWIDMRVDLGYRQSGGDIDSPCQSIRRNISNISAFTGESSGVERMTGFVPFTTHTRYKNVLSQNQMSVITPTITTNIKTTTRKQMLVALLVVFLIFSSLLTSSTNAAGVSVAKCDAFNGNISVPGVWCDFEGPCPWKWTVPKPGEAGFRKMTAAQVLTKIKELGEWSYRGPVVDSQNKTDGK